MGRLGNIRMILGGLGCEESEVTFFQTEELKTEIYPEFPIAKTEGRRNAQLMKSEDSTVQQVYSQV